MDDFWEILRKIVEDMMRGELDPEKALNAKLFYYGYSVTTGPDGKPVIREFGNMPSLVDESSLGEDIFVEARDLGDAVEVLADVHGYTPEEISVSVNSDHKTLVVRAGPNVERLELPAKVGKLLEKSYRNGTLRLLFKKKRGLLF